MDNQRILQSKNKIWNQYHFNIYSSTEKPCNLYKEKYRSFFPLSAKMVNDK